MKYYIGCSGFYYDEWKNIFYPKEIAKKNWLIFYAKHFNAVEINSSFYHNPSEKSLRNWYDNTPDSFLFSLKAPKLITHIKRFENVTEELNDFYLSIQNSLKEKLGCVLFQMPPSLYFTEENLQSIIAALDSSFRNVVEFRHASWWRKDVFDTLAEKKVIFCGQSYPSAIPDDAVVNNDVDCYYRFHGKPVLYKSLYSTESLAKIANTIKDSGRNAFIFFNNTWGGAALKNAAEMRELLS